MMFQIRVLTFTSHIDIMRCYSGSGIFIMVCQPCRNCRATEKNIPFRSRVLSVIMGL